MLRYILFLFAILSITYASAQKDTATNNTLEDVVVQVNKWEQLLKEVPNKLIVLSKEEILRSNAQTSADLLGKNAAVFIQKSQLGGGSPMIRGFSTNRVLLVVDGVRMNNAIFRSGNLQNILSIDPLSLQNVEVIFGPGSLVYGSDAIGGVMDFHTLYPTLSTRDKMEIHGGIVSRYSTANKERTQHYDFSLGGKKWAFVQSMSYSNYGDQKMGKHGGYAGYKRPEYVQRIAGKDSIVKNLDPLIQKFSGYDQLNLVHKLRFKPNKNLDFIYSHHYARTGAAPRYDRLIQYRNNVLRFAEWNYGPMDWQLHHGEVRYTKSTKLYDKLIAVAAYQKFGESRISRTRNSSNRNVQSEKVDAYTLNIDAKKSLKKMAIRYGVEYVLNEVFSDGYNENINTGVRKNAVSRYPTGSRTSNTSAYTSIDINANDHWIFTTGLRYSYNTVDAPFDTTFIKFPYRKVEIRDGAVTGNVAAIYNGNNGWVANANYSTGYRMPNIDDIGKLFENTPGFLTVPNPNLQPEYVHNFELGLIKEKKDEYQLEGHVYYTILENAILKRNFQFLGQDSIIFNGVTSRVEALQNIGKATVYGVELNARFNLNKHLVFETRYNLSKGRESDEVVDGKKVPLRHVPPFFGSTTLAYNKNKLGVKAEANFNGAISNKNLAPSEAAKSYLYAADMDGKPFSPSWYTFNLKFRYELSKNTTLSLDWENITNQQYRPYSSGIVAAGSNLILAFKAKF